MKRLELEFIFDNSVLEDCNGDRKKTVAQAQFLIDKFSIDSNFLFVW